MLRKILLGVVALVLIAVIGVVAMIGPKNVIGMLRYDQRHPGKLHVGDPAPNATLAALDGTQSVALRDHWQAKPLVLVFGSYT